MKVTTYSRIHKIMTVVLVADTERVSRQTRIDN